MEMSSTTDISQIEVLHKLGPLLLENLTSPDYKLTVEQQTSIQSFIQTFPNVIDRIAKDIDEIASDGKIDLHDIPAIIQLLADTYRLYSVTDGLLQGDISIVFIHYTINVIIDSKFVAIPDFGKQVIETVVNSCLTLLRMNIATSSAVKKGFCCWK
jgi:hypothetical protein